MFIWLPVWEKLQQGLSKVLDDFFFFEWGSPNKFTTIIIIIPIMKISILWLLYYQEQKNQSRCLAGQPYWVAPLRPLNKEYSKDTHTTNKSLKRFIFPHPASQCPLPPCYPCQFSKALLLVNPSVSGSWLLSLWRNQVSQYSAISLQGERLLWWFSLSQECPCIWEEFTSGMKAQRSFMFSSFPIPRKKRVGGGETTLWATELQRRYPCLNKLKKGMRKLSPEARVDWISWV